MKKKATRLLLTGEQVPEQTERTVTLPGPQTRCPGKWALLDMETGQVFCWSSGGKKWKAPPPMAAIALENLAAEMSRVGEIVQGVCRERSERKARQRKKTRTPLDRG